MLLSVACCEFILTEGLGSYRAFSYCSIKDKSSAASLFQLESSVLLFRFVYQTSTFEELFELPSTCANVAQYAPIFTYSIITSFPAEISRIICSYCSTFVYCANTSTVRRFNLNRLSIISDNLKMSSSFNSLGRSVSLLFALLTIHPLKQVVCKTAPRQGSKEKRPPSCPEPRTKRQPPRNCSNCRQHAQTWLRCY